jgi:hypothetical protein
MNLNTTFVALDNPSMQLPIFHGNGNNPQRLGRQYFEALRALQKFEDLFCDIEFHARDYYPLGDEAWHKARAQRQAQWENISSLRHYLDVHSGHCFQSAE